MTITKDYTPPEFCEYEWLKMKPKGIVFEGGYFVFLLEDADRRAILPLRYPVETADLLGVVHMQSLWRKSLGYLFQGVFKSWNVEFQRCVFVKNTTDSQRHQVRLYYKREQVVEFIEAPLEQVFGLCLEGQLPFFATRDYISRSQILEQDNEIFLQKQKWTEGVQRYLM